MPNNKIIYKIQQLLTLYVEEKILLSYEFEQADVPNTGTFTYIFITEEKCFFIITQDKQKKDTQCQHINSRKSEIQIGSEERTNSILKFVHSEIKARIWGFTLEKNALSVLEKYVHDNSGIISHVRRGTDLEDKAKKDFVLTCTVEGEQRPFYVSFDLKSNKDSVKDNRKRKLWSPSIHTSHDELANSPNTFIGKVLSLVTAIYRDRNNFSEISTTQRHIL